MLGRKRNIIILAIFTAAVLLGFIGESAVLETSDAATCELIAREMSRVIKTLESVRKPVRPEAQQVCDETVPEALQAVVQRGIIKSLPDGRWQWTKKITRAEGLYYFARLLEALSNELILYPVLISVETEFADIGPAHWLKDSLQMLAGTGALAGFSANRLLPDKTMKIDEVRQVGSALIEYLGSNCLLIVFDGKTGKMRTKGTVRAIELAGWRYSFDRRNWFSVDAEGTFIPDFKATNRQHIYFMNESYVQTGSFELFDGVRAAGMIRIQKKYSGHEVKKERRTLVKASTSDNENERQSLRNRLKELQKNMVASAPVALTVQAFPEPNLFERTTPPLSSGRALPQQSASAETAVEVKKEAEVINEIGNDNIHENVHENSSEISSEICEEPVEAEQKENSSFVIYEGGVTDAVTGVPVKGAAVIVAAKQITTDDSGKFSFSANPNEIVDLTVYSEGYEALSLRHRTGYRNGPLKLALNPVLTNLSGRLIHSESGRAVPKVLVKIGTRATRSDAEGNFYFKGIKPGYHQLSCFARGFMEAHEIIHVANEPVDNLEVKLRPIFEEFAERR